MQVIESGGGPYIFIDSRYAPTWLGADGRRFFDKELGDTDYQILEWFLTLRSNVARIDGTNSSAALIVPPFDLALIGSGEDYAFMAQAHYADADWSFSAVKHNDFDSAGFNEHLSFRSDGFAFFLFDAAYLVEETEKERIEFSISPGDYVLSAATYRPDDRTLLTLYRVQKAQ